MYGGGKARRKQGYTASRRRCIIESTEDERGKYMNVLIAPDSFKGSASSRELCDVMEEALHARVPGIKTRKMPMADGGEGTVEALVLATGGRFCEARVAGPMGVPVTAVFGVLGDGATAVLEMASASGLPLVPRDRRDIFAASSYGTGELIRAALDEGCRSFLMGIGGSATNEGGAGMLQALGFGLLDTAGRPIAPGAAGLAALDRVTCDRVDPRLAACKFRIACDVDAPLCGPRGASAVFGLQKGAAPEHVPVLDETLRRFGEILARDCGRDVAAIPGAGAAGGMGAGLMACLGARLMPGFALVCEVSGFAQALEGADLLITGEGEMNAQSLMGKLPVEAAKLAVSRGVRAVAIVGHKGEGAQRAEACGFLQVVELMEPGMSVEYSMAHVKELTRQAVWKLALTE